MGVSKAINELARRGLSAPRDRPEFAQRASNMGLPKLPLDCVAEVLDIAEGETHR